MRLSQLLRRPLVGRNGDVVGRVADVIVRLRGSSYPLVTGLVAQVGGRRVFLPIDRVSAFDGVDVQLTSELVDLRSFERREGEVLLRADVLGHRVIDVAEVELVSASDVELRETDGEWVLVGLDICRRSRLLGWLGRVPRPVWRDWTAFEPLVGHAPSARLRGAFARLGRLKPAQIADLLEEARRGESEEILDAVHADPELEADVFEELEPDSQLRLLRDKSNSDVAELLTRMRADDAADAINELPQQRRQPVLDLLPAGQRTKVLTLMGFNPTSAGGLMALDVLTIGTSALVADALDAVRSASGLQPEAVMTIYVTDTAHRLAGSATVIRLLHSQTSAPLSEIMETDPVRVGPDTDIVDVALLMADYNLITVPVVDDDDRVVGVITVDDVLEAILPEDWRRREPPTHPDHSDRPGHPADPVPASHPDPMT